MKLSHTTSIRRGINLARVLSLGLALLAVEIHSCRLQASPEAAVWVVASSPIPAPIRNALLDLREAVVSKGRQLHIVKRIPKAGGDVVVIGLAGSGQMGSEILRGISGQQPSTPESFLIRRLQLDGRQAIVAIGADERGLMYAIYELAERVRWAGPLDPVFKHVADISEEPFIRERAVSIYTMSKPYFESRLYDEKHWRK